MTAMDFKEISPALQKKYQKLESILQQMQSVLVAFSGGVDSTLLLNVAHRVLGDKVLAVIATSETYPDKEIQEAIALTKDMGVRYQVIESCEMENPNFVSNPPDRCYHCKMELFSKIKDIAHNEGIPYVLDGSNYDDTDDYRPGARAVAELEVRSPLKEVELTKQEIRELSLWLELPTWDKPAMACLSSRFPYYSEINSAALKQIAQAEEFLRTLGFSQLRVRHHDTMARIEVPAEDIQKVLDSGLRDAIVQKFKELGYTYITLDLAGYRTGSLNETLPPDLKQQG